MDVYLFRFAVCCVTSLNTTGERAQTIRPIVYSNATNRACGEVVHRKPVCQPIRRRHGESPRPVWSGAFGCCGVGGAGVLLGVDGDFCDADEEAFLDGG
ncbi:hypothetical protein, partial [Subtercola boreus]|uniref:hypothetical protein n=1 Tax=Subtercola boreus TaxID=120213 RepID=UPI001C0EB018